MAEYAGALAVANVVLGVGQAVQSYNVSRANVRRERKLAELRAEDRREELRRVLAAQRLALVGQGAVPDVGSGLVLQREAARQAARESALDRFQTEGAVQQHRAEGLSGVLRGAGLAGSSLLSYSYAKRETRLGRTGG